MTPRSLVQEYDCFRGTYCHHVHFSYPRDEGSMFLWNIISPFARISGVRKWQYWSPPQCKRHVLPI